MDLPDQHHGCDTCPTTSKDWVGPFNAVIHVCDVCGKDACDRCSGMGEATDGTPMLVCLKCFEVASAQEGS